MIKFDYAIHKETNNIIDYNIWVECAKQGNFYVFMSERNPLREHMKLDTEIVKSKRYTAMDIIFSDDFKIVY